MTTYYSVLVLLITAAATVHSEYFLAEYAANHDNYEPRDYFLSSIKDDQEFQGERRRTRHVQNEYGVPNSDGLLKTGQYSLNPYQGFHAIVKRHATVSNFTQEKPIYNRTSQRRGHNYQTLKKEIHQQEELNVDKNSRSGEAFNENTSNRRTASNLNSKTNKNINPGRIYQSPADTKHANSQRQQIVFDNFQAYANSFPSTDSRTTQSENKNDHKRRRDNDFENAFDDFHKNIVKKNSFESTFLGPGSEGIEYLQSDFYNHPPNLDLRNLIPFQRLPFSFSHEYHITPQGLIQQNSNLQTSHPEIPNGINKSAGDRKVQLAISLVQGQPHMYSNLQKGHENGNGASETIPETNSPSGFLASAEAANTKPPYAANSQPDLSQIRPGYLASAGLKGATGVKSEYVENVGSSVINTESSDKRPGVQISDERKLESALSLIHSQPHIKSRLEEIHRLQHIPVFEPFQGSPDIFSLHTNVNNGHFNLNPGINPAPIKNLQQSQSVSESDFGNFNPGINPAPTENLQQPQSVSNGYKNLNLGINPPAPVENVQHFQSAIGNLKLGEVKSFNAPVQNSNLEAIQSYHNIPPGQSLQQVPGLVSQYQNPLSAIPRYVYFNYDTQGQNSPNKIQELQQAQFNPSGINGEVNAQVQPSQGPIADFNEQTAPVLRKGNSLNSQKELPVILIDPPAKLGLPFFPSRQEVKTPYQNGEMFGYEDIPLVGNNTNVQQPQNMYQNGATSSGTETSANVAERRNFLTASQFRGLQSNVPVNEQSVSTYQEKPSQQSDSSPFSNFPPGSTRETIWQAGDPTADPDVEILVRQLNATCAYFRFNETTPGNEDGSRYNIWNAGDYSAQREEEELIRSINITCDNFTADAMNNFTSGFTLAQYCSECFTTGNDENNYNNNGNNYNNNPENYNTDGNNFNTDGNVNSPDLSTLQINSDQSGINSNSQGSQYNFNLPVLYNGDNYQQGPTRFVFYSNGDFGDARENGEIAGLYKRSPVNNLPRSRKPAENQS